MKRTKNEEKKVLDFPNAMLETIGQINVDAPDDAQYEVDPVTGELVRAKKTAEVKFVTMTMTDVNGEVITQVTKAHKYANGSGFVISYTEKMSDFLMKVSTGSIVRVFLYIAHHQNYGTDGKTFGYRCSHKYLQQILRIDKSTLWDALKYLKDNYLVHVGKVEGYVEFMVNPDYVTIGQDKKARRAEWNRRWQATLKEQAQKNMGSVAPKEN